MRVESTNKGFYEFFKEIEARFAMDFTLGFQAELIKSLQQEPQIVIMGAGRQGQYLHAALKVHNIQNVTVWDNYVSENSKLDFSVSRPDYNIDKNTLVIVAIAYSFDQIEIAEQFHKAGFWRVIENGSLLTRMITCALRASPKEVPAICPKCNYDFGACLRYYNFLDQTGILKNKDGLVLPKLSYNITTRCTLKCKHCGQRIFMFNEDTHIHVGVSTVVDDIAKVMKAIKYVNFFGLLGGEPLVHNTLHIVIEQLLQYGSIGTIVIFTNGTIVPWKELIEISKNNKVLYQVDDYGEPYPGYREQYAKVIDVLQQNGIPFFQTKTLTWFDYTDTHKRNDMPEVLKNKFSTCRFSKDLALKDGYLFKCSNSFHEWVVGIKTEEEIEGDIFCFKNKSTEEIKTALQQFVNISYLKSCDYCAGCDYQNVIPAAIQLEKGNG